MILPLAHAGHWLVNVLYLAPVLVLGAALGWQSFRERGKDVEDRHNS